MKLFKFDDYNVVIAPEALTLKPFKKLWNRDRTINKTKATTELSIIYFLCDPRSDYMYIVDEDKRLQAILEGEGLDNKWKPDEDFNRAKEFYQSFKTTAEYLLEDTRVAVDKLRKMLRDINLEDTDNNGRPIYTLNVITNTIKQVPVLVKDLNEAERSLAKELEEAETRGTMESTIFDDDLDA